MGYGQEEFEYRLRDPVNKKIIRSGDVVFFKNQTIEDLEKSKKTIEGPFDEIPIRTEYEHRVEEVTTKREEELGNDQTPYVDNIENSPRQHLKLEPTKNLLRQTT